MTPGAEEHADLIVLLSEYDDGVEITLVNNRHGPTGRLYDSHDHLVGR